MGCSISTEVGALGPERDQGGKARRQWPPRRPWALPRPLLEVGGLPDVLGELLDGEEEDRVHRVPVVVRERPPFLKTGGGGVSEGPKQLWTRDSKIAVHWETVSLKNWGFRGHELGGLKKQPSPGRDRGQELGPEGEESCEGGDDS